MNGVWKERERDSVGEEGLIGAIEDGRKRGVDIKCFGVAHVMLTHFGSW